MIFSYENNNIWPLAFFSPLFFLFVFRKRNISKKAALFYGFFYGAVISLGGFYWLIYTLKVFGGMPAWAAYILFILYSIAFNLKFPIYFILLRYVKKLKLPVWFLYSALFTALEFFVYELFPWSYGGSQYKNIYFIQSADIGGIYLLTFLVFAFSFWIYYGYKFIKILLSLPSRRKKDFLSPFTKKYKSINRQFYILTLLILINYAYGFIQYNNYSRKIEKAKKINIAMIQPSSSLGFKGYYSDSYAMRTLEYLIKKASLKAGKEGKNISLFVIPEGAIHSISSDKSNNNPYYSKKFHRFILRNIYNTNTSFFVNEIESAYKVIKKNNYKFRKRLTYNSSSMLNSRGVAVSHYHKNFLLPFGEYIPFPDIFGLKTWILKNTNASDFSKGRKKMIIPLRYYDKKKSYPVFPAVKSDSLDYIQNLLQEDKNNRSPDKLTYFIPVICYEILSGEYIRSFPDKEKAGFLLNVTNDRWFGDVTKGSYQHMQLGLFRSIENRKGLVRNTNSGVSLYIDARGEVNKSSIMKQTKKEFRIVSVAQMHNSTLYQILGDWPPKFFALVFIILYLKIFLFRFLRQRN